MFLWVLPLSATVGKSLGASTSCISPQLSEIPAALCSLEVGRCTWIPALPVGIQHFIVLRSIVLHRLTLHRQQDYASHDCDTHFIVAVRFEPTASQSHARIRCDNDVNTGAFFSGSQAANPAGNGEQRLHWQGILENFTCKKSTIPKEIYQRKRLLCRSPFPGQLPTSGSDLDTLINTRPVRCAARSGRIQPGEASSLARTQHLSAFYKLVVLWVPSCT